MKNEKMKGFLAGVMMTVLVAGLGVSALAATNRIEVSDGVTITINGAAFTPRDANGNPVPVFSYNGTVYGPVRAICQAAGLQVGYDTGTNTAQITTPEVARVTQPNSGSYITEAQAREIALAHAGVGASDTVFLKSCLDWDNGCAEYEVEFYCGWQEYDYDIDAVTGAVRRFDHDCDNYDVNYHHNNGYSGGHHSGGRHSGIPSTAGLITMEQAQAIALAQTPAGTVVTDCALDVENGRYVYEVELRNGRTEYEFKINAATGIILERDVDYD